MFFSCIPSKTLHASPMRPHLAYMSTNPDPTTMFLPKPFRSAIS
uniref:Uncharacterized protein n=1 Tax=Arundo donax TaxID=35708 RepID=A0A0A9BM13_ARUDO